MFRRLNGVRGCHDIPVAQAFKAEAFPNRTAIFVNGKFQAAYRGERSVQSWHCGKA